MSVRGISPAVNEIFVYMDTFIQQMDMFLCNGKNFTFIHWFDTSKDTGQSNEFYVMHTVQLILLYNAFTCLIHLFISSSLMCVFPCLLLQHHQCCVLYYFLSLLLCLSILQSQFFIVAVTYDFYHILLCNFYNCDSLL